MYFSLSIDRKTEFFGLSVQPTFEVIEQEKSYINMQI